MAGSLQRTGATGRRGPRFKPSAEINVTPLVDVMLVLLIVFMVSAPLLTVGVAVELPKTKAPPLPVTQKPLEITVTADGKVYLQETEIALDELAPKLVAIAKAGERGLDERIYVRGDTSVAYGAVMGVMATLNAAGFTNLGLVTDPVSR